MSDMKRKLDRMMGDTSEQERRIKQGVQNRLRPSARKSSWKVAMVSVALPAVALLLFFSMNPANLFSSDQGPGTPYDPLDDLAQISAFQKKQQLSAVDVEEFAKLPNFDVVDGLYYVDPVPFSRKGSSETFHTVIERKADIYDRAAYQAGDVVRTMTDTTSHLPTYKDVYYEVIAVPGDRVKLQDGVLKINGKPLESELMDRYKEQNVRIAGGYDQVLNAREYLLLNHFPADRTVQGATITPVHKIYGQVAGIATEERTTSIYMDYLADRQDGVYSPEQYFDLYLYDTLLGDKRWPQPSAFAGTTRLGELFVEASYRNATQAGDHIEIRYQYGREGVADRTFSMTQDPGSGQWMIEQ
ncbi:S26 family signal peptidase [Sporosarcina cyprini]|uniref:S26 family signal peptidase n=1 Tax=Sporosarcina cyprini TaxID=2910523 RepID=UPI001EDF16C1|nr:S26 family signal peptidase [Sporosarcina cyprini]MCG3088422.1 S26 family signal peptidase [Sporosarcina cyprini]